MYEARSAEYIRIYESIVGLIEFFLRLEIHKIGTYVTWFYIENHISIVGIVKPGNISHSFLITPDLAAIKKNSYKNSRFVDPNLLF